MVLLTVASLIAGSAGCRSHAPVVQPTEAKFIEDSLIDGKTSKTDVVLQWGFPAATYANEEILTYHLASKGDSELRVVRPRPDPHDHPLSRWDDGNFNLILVFDRNEVLQRHSLIKVY